MGIFRSNMDDVICNSANCTQRSGTVCMYFTPNVIGFVKWWEMRGRTCSMHESDYADSSEDGLRERQHLKDLSVHSGTGLALQWHVTSLDETGLIRPRTGTGRGRRCVALVNTVMNFWVP
jgi:hypothetical protein